MTRQSKQELKQERDYYKAVVEGYDAMWERQGDEESDREVAQSDYDVISDPEHYLSHPSGIEPIQITAYETFLRGNIIKYVMRAPYKGNELEDLEKARQYLDWEIEAVRRERQLER